VKRTLGEIADSFGRFSGDRGETDAEVGIQAGTWISPKIQAAIVTNCRLWARCHSELQSNGSGAAAKRV
jgi:hypothetical protein